MDKGGESNLQTSQTEGATKPQPIPVPGDSIPRKLPPKQITLSCEVVTLDSAAKTLDVKLGEKEQRVVLLDQLGVHLRLERPGGERDRFGRLHGGDRVRQPGSSDRGNVGGVRGVNS